MQQTIYYTASFLVFISILFTLFVSFKRLLKTPQVLQVSQSDKIKRSDLLFIALCSFVFSFSVLVFFIVIGLEKTNWQGITPALQHVFDNSIDARHYMKLAEFGYGNSQEFHEQHLMIVFFPLFPLIVNFFHSITGLNFYVIGSFIQPFLFAGFATLFYLLIHEQFGEKIAKMSLVFLYLMPTSFFFATPMTESLYALLATACFYAIQKNKPILFAISAFLATLTRPTGVLFFGVAIVVFIIFMFLKQLKLSWFACSFAPLLGFGLYLLLNFYHYNDFFAYSKIQESHWQNTLVHPFNTIKYCSHYMFDWWDTNPRFSLYTSFATIIIIVFQLILFAVLSHKLPLHWLAYSVAFIIFSYSISWLLSAPRYSLSLVFVPAGLALICKNKFAKLFAFAFMGIVWLLYLQQFLIGGIVY